MPELNIYETTLGQVLRVLNPQPAPKPKPSQPKPPKPYAEYDVVALQYKINLPQDIYDFLQSKPLLKQHIQLDMIGVGKVIVGRIAVPRGQKVDAAFKQRVSNALDQGKGDVVALIDRILKRHDEMSGAFKAHKATITKDMIMFGVGVLLTTVGLAVAAPTGGASLGLAIAAGVRSLATGVAKLGDCWRTAEEQELRLRNSITVLLKAYQRSVHQGRAMQITGAILDTSGVLPAIEMLPFIRQQLMPSMAKIKADLAVYKGKLGSLYTAANQLAAQLFDLLDQVEEWKRLNPNWQTFKPEDPRSGPVKVEARIKELLDSGVRIARFRHKLTVGEAYKRYDDGMQKVVALEKMIGDINNIEKHPRAVAIIAALIKVLGNMAFTAGGQAAGAADFSPTAAGIGSTTIGAANDTMGTITDLVDFAEVAKGDASSTQMMDYASKITASYASIPVSLPVRAPVATGATVPRPLGKPLNVPTPPAPTRAAPPPPSASAGPSRPEPQRPAFAAQGGARRTP